jgi:hypothetical protein
MRLPYSPPDEGFPDFHFASNKNKTWQDENGNWK